MKASGQVASYLSVLAVSSGRRDRRWTRQVLPFRWQRWSRFHREIRQDSSSYVTLSLGVLVVHVVAGLAIVAVAGVATGEHVLRAA